MHKNMTKKRAQSVAYRHARRGSFVTARAYCTACSWEDVQACQVPLDIVVVGLDTGPRRQPDPCTCGGTIWVDVTRD